MAPWGEMAWRQADVRMEDQGAGRYRLSTDRPVPVVWLTAPGAAFSDNFFPLFPDAERIVVVQGAPSVPVLDHWPY